MFRCRYDSLNFEEIKVFIPIGSDRSKVVFKNMSKEDNHAYVKRQG